MDKTVDKTPTPRYRQDGAKLRRKPILAPSIVVPGALVLVAYGLIIPKALQMPLIGAAGVGLLVVVIMVATVGVDRASTALLVLAFGFAPLTSFVIGPKPLVLASAIFAAAVALALPRLLRTSIRLPPMFIIGTVLFSIMGFLAVPLAIDPFVSLLYLLPAIVALSAMPAVIVWMGPTDKQMWAMMLAFAIGTALSTLYGIPRNVYRNAGFTYHPVALAYTATLTLSFVPYLLSTKVRGRWVVVPPLAVIAVIGIWTSGSRTGLLVLLALILLIPVIERSIALGLAVASGFVLALPTLLNLTVAGNSTTALSRLTGAGGAQGSDAIRRDTLADGWHQIQSSPIFGNGYSIEHTYVIHNIYIQVLAAEGLIGLLGILMIFVVLVAPLRKLPAPRRCLAYPAVVVVLSGPFQPNMSDHYLGMSLGLSLVGAVTAMRAKDGARGGKEGGSDGAAADASDLPESPGGEVRQANV